jgi:hypothetical protein
MENIAKIIKHFYFEKHYFNIILEIGSQPPPPPGTKKWLIMGTSVWWTLILVK